MPRLQGFIAVKNVISDLVETSTLIISGVQAVTKSANYQILASDNGKIFLLDTTSFTHTLPLLSSVNPGFSVTFLVNEDQAVGIFTPVQPTDSGTFWGPIVTGGASNATQGTGGTTITAGGAASNIGDVIYVVSTGTAWAINGHGHTAVAWVVGGGG